MHFHAKYMAPTDRYCVRWLVDGMSFLIMRRQRTGVIANQNTDIAEWPFHPRFERRRRRLLCEVFSSGCARLTWPVGHVWPRCSYV